MIRLKDLNEKFYVFNMYERDDLGTRYKLYDINRNSGKVQNHRFLDMISFDSKKGIVYQDGSKYTDIDILYKDIYEYADSLLYHSDYYDPSYRVGIKEMYCIRDYMLSIGFTTAKNQCGSMFDTTYVMNGANPLFGGTYMEITVKINEDTTTGTITQTSGRAMDYRWIEETFDDLDECIGKINSLINSQLLITCSTAMANVDKMIGKMGDLTGTTNKFDTNSLETYSANTKEILIQKLEEALNTLKSR